MNINVALNFIVLLNDSFYCDLSLENKSSEVSEKLVDNNVSRDYLLKIMYNCQSK